MRTTIDLRPDLHRKASSIARDTHRSLSDTVNDLLARVLDRAEGPTITTSPVTGFPVVRLGRVITAEDVRSLEDE